MGSNPTGKWPIYFWDTKGLMISICASFGHKNPGFQIRMLDLQSLKTKKNLPVIVSQRESNLGGWSQGAAQSHTMRQTELSWEVCGGGAGQPVS